MSKYILKITPTSQYFFGAENRKASDNTANYFLHSLAFPQQSTVLGAVRYFFLKFVCPETIFKNNEIIDKSPNGAEKYIGKASFDITAKEFDFGKIKAISEVFLMKGDTPFIPLPFDKWNETFGDITSVGESSNFLIPKYDAKQHYELQFTDGSNTETFSKIFKERIQSGNQKNNKGDDDDDAYYKQQYFCLTKDWSFAVELTTDEDLKVLNAPMYMPMGGENKLFKIEIVSDYKLDRNVVLKKFNHKLFYKLVLVSDAYTSIKGINEEALCSFVQTKTSRNLKSSIAKTNKYRNRSEDKSVADSMTASSQFELIERGSTFYFKGKSDAENFTIKYLQNDYLQNSGLNQYIIINPQL